MLGFVASNTLRSATVVMAVVVLLYSAFHSQAAQSASGVIYSIENTVLDMFPEYEPAVVEVVYCGGDTRTTERQLRLRQSANRSPF